MPIHIPDRAGQPYRPSNGTEGYLFMEAFCENCCLHKPDYPECDCQIILKSMIYDIDQPERPDEWRFDDRGRPECTAFERKGDDSQD